MHSKWFPTLMVVMLPFGLCADAAPMGYGDRSAWVNAVGRDPDQILFFDESAAGPDTVSTANDTPIDTNTSPLYLVDFYAEKGIEFQSFEGTDVFPVIRRNQDFQMLNSNGQDGTAPGRFRDALLGNSSSPNPTSDLDGRAIRATFLVEVFTFGVRVNNLDGGFVDAFDQNNDLILSQPLASGGFSGIISDVPINAVRIVNTFDSDILFGIYDCQYHFVPLLMADFDSDGDVDGDDFLTWQAGFGTGTTHEEGDADGDGDVDGDDFLDWQTEFGSGSGSASAAVPEPASMMLVVAALVGGMIATRLGKWIGR